MAIKKGDFVRLDFTGRIAETGEVFDTTKESVAKEHGLAGRNVTFEPLTVCVGEGFLLPALDAALVGKGPEGTFSITLSAEDAFGKKRADRIKLMPLSAFKKQEVVPQPGLEVDIDGVRGVVRNVTGNRIIVDFNHPLAGKELTYEVMLEGTVDELPEQVEAIVGRMLGFSPKITIDEGKAVLELPLELPEQAQKQVSDEVAAHTAATGVEFRAPKKSDA